MWSIKPSVSLLSAPLLLKSFGLSQNHAMRSFSVRRNLLFFFLRKRRPPRSPLFPSTPLFRSDIPDGRRLPQTGMAAHGGGCGLPLRRRPAHHARCVAQCVEEGSLSH